MSLVGRPTPTSLSSEPSPDRFGSLTNTPRQHHRKEEEDPHLHIDKIQLEQSLSNYA
jgi:hypothetical protein